MELPKFLRRKEAPKSVELPPVIFSDDELGEYESAALKDSKLQGLLTSRAEILAYQESGQGVFEDSQRRSQIESAIAERFRSLKSNAVF